MSLWTGNKAGGAPEKGDRRTNLKSVATLPQRCCWTRRSRYRTVQYQQEELAIICFHKSGICILTSGTVDPRGQPRMSGHQMRTEVHAHRSAQASLGRLAAVAMRMDRHRDRDRTPCHAAASSMMPGWAEE